ncbi:MAG: hypothetical protein NVS1B13_12130 [Flavisolibacter sp.]
MLGLVTEYLLLYKRVCIPYIGTFEIVHQPAGLDVADKAFLPPTFITQYDQNQTLSEHQVSFFALCNQAAQEKQKTELLSFGLVLKSKIQQEAFEWNGFGTLQSSSEAIVFTAHKILLPSLQQLPAEKVIYAGSSHPVLVGDRQISSLHIGALLHLPLVKRSLVLLIGWALLTVAIIFLVYRLYKGHFEGGSMGLSLIILF